MTAVVGILNKQAIAIAADSAVTISGAKSTILNKANKIFTLSKYRPVAVMIYNSASFMGVPWETIIKMYRRQLGDTSFPTLGEYIDNFVNYIKSKKFFCTIDDENEALLEFTKFFLQTLYDNIWIKDGKNTITQNKSEETALLTSFIDATIADVKDSGDYCCEFVDLTMNDIEPIIKNEIDKIMADIFPANSIEINADLAIKVKELIFEVVRTQETLSSFTGLIFTGFGEEEIYPSLIPVDISFCFRGRLRYFIEEGRRATISNKMPGSISPFAQIDVIETILSGIDPLLNAQYLKNFLSILQKYNTTVLAFIGDKNPIVKQAIESLDLEKLSDEFNLLNNEIKLQNYISPLMTAVSNLSKEDLSEMAESLIYLTYLKRRITFAEESVGGPVDVAIISKGDGFVWIKRKEYFKSELNKHFLDNYLNA